MDEQQPQVLNLIISQLKSYGYYSLAKNIGQQTGVQTSSVEPSNKLQEAVKDIAIPSKLDQNLTGMGSVVASASGPEKGLVWDGKNHNKMNPNYRNWFNTQHREFARAVGIYIHPPSLIRLCSF